DPLHRLEGEHGTRRVATQAGLAGLLLARLGRRLGRARRQRSPARAGRASEFLSLRTKEGPSGRCGIARGCRRRAGHRGGVAGRSGGSGRLRERSRPGGECEGDQQHAQSPPGPDGRHGGTATAERVKGTLQFDYTAVGHVTVDVLADGTRRPGGSAFYSALQAAPLGRRTLILTQGVPGEIEQMLEPYRDELELRVLPARRTTTFEPSGWGPTGAQHVLAWAGPIERDLKLDTAILHLAPV